jgi:hypothetical protein
MPHSVFPECRLAKRCEMVNAFVQQRKQKHKSNAGYFREDKTVVMSAVPAESCHTGEYNNFCCILFKSQFFSI